MARSDTTPIHDLQVVCLELGGESYAVEIGRVHEIIRLQEITPIPRAPSFVEGVINLRGRILPVIDLRRRLDLPSMAPTKRTRIAIVEMAEHTVGVVVDGVTRVLRLEGQTIEPPSPYVTGINSEYLRGIARVGNDLVVLLDLDRILTPRQNEEIGTVGYTGTTP
jgi:purine-binding chemotaxis protein CheW